MAVMCGAVMREGYRCPETRKPRLGGVLVARAGIEPATFHFSGERCYQLSYLAVATPTGLDPATSAVTGRRANQLRYGANFLTTLPASSASPITIA